MGPELHDIVVPEAVPWTPQTPAWAVLAGLAAVFLVWAAWTFARRRRANRYRRVALGHLDRLARRGAFGELPALVKRTALAVYPRAEVASLSGEPWLRFLDASYGGDGFTAGPGRLLPRLAYSPSEPSHEEIAPLVEIVRVWIRRHRRRV